MRLLLDKFSIRRAAEYEIPGKITVDSKHSFWYHARMDMISKRIVIALKLSVQSGQRRLAGILAGLASSQQAWDIRIKRDASEFQPSDVGILREWSIDGLIFGLPGFGPAAEETAAEVVRLGIPTVVCEENAYVAPRAARRNLVFVDSTCEACAAAAAGHFLRQGKFRGYGFLADRRHVQHGVRLGRAFREKLADAGQGCAVFSSPAGNTDDFHLLRRWLAALPRPAAVFVASDSRGLTVLEAARAEALSVPGELAVLGFGDDDNVCNWSKPSLSSVLPDDEGVGANAARQLMALMENRPPPPPLRLKEPTVVIRGTSATQETQAGVMVQKALAYIRRHATDKIDPGAVASALAVSRRLLDLRFREILDRTVASEIRERRLEILKQRLPRSTDTIERLALDCGFDNADYVKHLFRTRFGFTMRAWRLSAGVPAAGKACLGTARLE